MKKKKAKAVRTLPSKALNAKHAKSVRGGRKAGAKPVEYLKVKMSDLLISS